MQEQLMVILTTTLSLLTAWSWNSVVQQYVDQYFGRSLSTRLLCAIIITIITVLMINWLLNHFKDKPEKIENIKKTLEISDLSNYIL